MALHDLCPFEASMVVAVDPDAPDATDLVRVVSRLHVKLMDKGASFGATVLVVGAAENGCTRVEQEAVSGVRVGTIAPRTTPRTTPHGWSLVLERGGTVRDAPKDPEQARRLVLEVLSSRP